MTFELHLTIECAGIKGRGSGHLQHNMVQYYSPRHRPPNTPLWGEPHCRFGRYHSIGPSSSGTSFHITSLRSCLASSSRVRISDRQTGVRKSARLCYPNSIYFVFPSFKNSKKARYHINASVQVSKIRYLSHRHEELARRINTRMSHALDLDLNGEQGVPAENYQLMNYGIGIIYFRYSVCSHSQCNVQEASSSSTSTATPRPRTRWRTRRGGSGWSGARG